MKCEVFWRRSCALGRRAGNLRQGDTVDETIVALQEARRGAKRQKGALSATGQLRVAELVKLFAVEEEA